VSITENEGSADVQSVYMWSSYQDLAWIVTVMLPSLVNLQLVKDISYCLEYSCSFQQLPNCHPLQYVIYKKKLLQKP